MGLETGVDEIADLNENWPLSTDERYQGDDHLRNIKIALKSLLTNLAQIGAEEEDHAADHQHGGADEVATATPAANAIPKAGAGGTLAAGWLPRTPHWASTLDGTITGSGTSWAVDTVPLASLPFVLFRNGVAQKEGAGKDFTRSGVDLTLVISLGGTEWLGALYWV